jgi:uncharacterized NAD(P)/FAD-binding protein YdhS
VTATGLHRAMAAQRRRTGPRHRLLLIGGGVACASVVLHLAERFRSQREPDVEPFEIILVDPAAETGGGDPYPTGLSPALLLNDPLPVLDATGVGFTAWLRDRHGAWWPRLLDEPDPRVVRWVRRNRAAVLAGTWDGLFLPRGLFGDFIRERVADAARVLAARGIALRVMAGEVRALRPRAGGGWLATVDTRPEPCPADTVVLGVGSLLPAPPAAIAGHPAYLTYRRARDVAALTPALADLPPGPEPIVVLGTSAAACEALYLLEDAVAGNVVALSRGGLIPDGLPSGLPPDDRPMWTPAEPTAAALVDAVTRGLARGTAAGYTVVDLLPAVRVLFDRAWELLPAVQRQRFVEDHAPRYRAAIRHISTDYAAAVRRLRATGRLSVRPGEVAGIEASVAPGGAGRLQVAVARNGGPAEHLTARAVLDCRGFTGVRDTDHPLVLDLLAGGAVRANPTGRGLDVDAALAAAPGLYVLGPALAGTARGGDHIWSLENIPRIYALAERVAGAVLDQARKRARVR